MGSSSLPKFRLNPDPDRYFQDMDMHRSCEGSLRHGLSFQDMSRRADRQINSDMSDVVLETLDIGPASPPARVGRKKPQKNSSQSVFWVSFLRGRESQKMFPLRAKKGYFMILN